MADDNLLVSLRRYRPSEGRDSLEDYLTEIFAWLLRNYRSIADAFLSSVVDRLSEIDRIELPHADQELSIETQVSYPGARLDMIVSWPEVALIFEHKVHSPLHQQQILKYLALAETEFRDQASRVIIISANTGQHRDEANACMCWEDIYDLLEPLNNQLSDAAEQFHVSSFLALLRHEGLHPAAPVSHQAIAFYPVARRFPEQFAEMLAPLANFEWPVPAEFSGKMHSARWGRLGFELTFKNHKLSWIPGIFVGVILDGRDHLVAHRHPDEVMLNIIIDFSSKTHSYYQRLPAYNQLVNQLKRVFPQKGWTLYLHSEDKPFNKYHPIYLETSLLKLLRGTSTISEQRDRVYRVVYDALSLLQQGEILTILKDEIDTESSK